jgi:hypothetical protein
VRLTIPGSHRVTIDVPAEVPAGEAEVILLTGAPVSAALPGNTSFETRFRPNPALGPIEFHEDPTAPLAQMLETGRAADKPDLLPTAKRSLSADNGDNLNHVPVPGDATVQPHQL